MTSDARVVSVVVPCFNESANIRALYERLRDALETRGYADFELLFVENGSADDSAAIILGLRERDPRVKMIQLSRNYGYQGAISAGMSYVSGDAVVTIDCDLQDPPERVPDLLDGLGAGNDVVYGVRTRRREGLWIRLCYKLFYVVWQKLSHIHVPRDAGDFCAMSRRVVDQMVALPERNRFLRGLRVWVGFRHAPLPYQRDARHAGESKFSLAEYFALATDALISFSTLPLRLLLAAGCLLAVLLMVAGVVLVVLRTLALFDVLPPEEFPKGFTITNLLLMAFATVNLLGIGIIGEYVGRIYEETKRRPLFIVSRLVGVDRTEPPPA